MLEAHKPDSLHGYQCYQSIAVQTCFDWGSVHANLFFAKALCVTEVLRLVTAPEKTPPLAWQHALRLDYRFLAFCSKPFVDIIFWRQLWMWKKVLTHLCSIALVFLLMFLRASNVAKNTA